MRGSGSLPHSLPCVVVKAHWNSSSGQGAPCARGRAAFAGSEDFAGSSKISAPGAQVTSPPQGPSSASPAGPRDTVKKIYRRREKGDVAVPQVQSMTGKRNGQLGVPGGVCGQVGQTRSPAEFPELSDSAHAGHEQPSGAESARSTLLRMGPQLIRVRAGVASLQTRQRACAVFQRQAQFSWCLWPVTSESNALRR